MSDCFKRGRNVKKVTPSTAIYGAEWAGTSSPIWTRTDDAALFSDPSPAVNNGNGSSPFDTIMPWAGMVREERTGGTMVKIPKYWYKWTRNGIKMKLQITNVATTGFLVSPAHADRGDGKGERDYVYAGAYHCANGTYKSTTGVVPKNTVTRKNARTAIHNLGANIWQYDFAMYWTIMMLYLVEYANWNSQAVIGWGCTQSTLYTAPYNNGLCDSMVYHTGTNKSSRTSVGVTRYRYIEGLWDNVLDYCDGIYRTTGWNAYCIKNPASFSDDTGGTYIGALPQKNGYYITSWSDPSNISKYEYALIPATIVDSNSGAEDTYICDYAYGGSGSNCVVSIGGWYGAGSGFKPYGAFCLRFNAGVNSSDTNIGCRLMELP